MRGVNILVLLVLLAIGGRAAENEAAAIGGNFSSLLIDCQPDNVEHEADEASCLTKGCLWSDEEKAGAAPKCTFPDSEEMVGYDVVETENSTTSETALPYSATLKRRSTPSLYGDDFEETRVAIESVSDSESDIVRVKITGGEARSALYPEWRENLKEAPRRGELLGREENENENETGPIEALVERNPFGFALVRRSTNRTIFDTRRIPGLTLARQFVQMSARVPTRYVYGFGETNHEQFKHKFDHRKWGMFSHDKLPGFDDTNLYGVHPFYLCVEDDSGNSHGVLFLNTHAMHVQLQPDEQREDGGGGVITWRAVGGALEFFLFSGPTPDHVIGQYNRFVGRPQFPPYWSMGFQISRWGYKDTDDVRRVFGRNLEAGIPQDTQVVDIDYMRAKMDFTYDPAAFGDLPKFAEELHESGRKLILILDPAIPLNYSDDDANATTSFSPMERGLADGVFITDNRTGEPLEGEVWPGPTYFPDFTNPRTGRWWADMIKEFYEHGVQFDGLWIDMNEPANFLNGSATGCRPNKYTEPPFNPLNYKGLSSLTVCMDADQYLGKHYELHSVYGYGEAVATYNALKGGEYETVLTPTTTADGHHEIAFNNNCNDHNHNTSHFQAPPQKPSDIPPTRGSLVEVQELILINRHVADRVDSVSRYIFPFSFLLFNAIYWSYYLRGRDYVSTSLI